MMGSSFDADSSISSSLMRGTLMRGTLTSDTLTDGSLMSNRLMNSRCKSKKLPWVITTWGRTRKRESEMYSTDGFPFDLGGTFSLSGKNIKMNIFKNVWMDEHELTYRSEEDLYNYTYQSRYSRQSELKVKMDEYSLKRRVIPPIGEVEKKMRKMKKKINKIKINSCMMDNRSDEDASAIDTENWKGREGENKSGVNMKRGKYSHSNRMRNNYDITLFGLKNVNMRNIFTNHGIHDMDKICNIQKEVEEYVGGGGENNILFENAWTNIKLNECKHKVHLEDPIGNSPYLSYPIQFCIEETKESRHVSKEPYKILSAPNLVDDFYLNLLDWSKKNIISIALNDKLCIWNENISKGDELFTLKKKKTKKMEKKKKRINDKKKSITSLKWDFFGNSIAVGLSNGIVEIWDVEKNIKIRKYKNHKLRVGTLCWYYNTLTTGSKDKKIICSDIRCKENSYLHLNSHTSEICGLKWNYNTKQLASGGNDNSVYIWEWRKNDFLFQFSKHKAAVKALSWCPHKHNLLATGGGSADKNIYFWNTTNGNCVNQVHTNSQVSNIFWSKNTHEFISTHSYSLAQIVLWNYPKLRKISTLSGHKLRILYGSLSPNGESIATGSPDETVRLWNVFPGKDVHMGWSTGRGNYLSHLFPFSNCYEQVR
ncbi:cell division cycle protein 20 homolog [Plasmodium gonderi]|uniref:Cell division cycle protein 20 homolog n=1 Tax=Plasmodium gonderi TaxID=77519 RepID=A0A1Y1JF51_PLAGO|nr:cell division cycle protein 20 homolog [Plasmodium gonderi]GAW79965.1 cell division cycle protein 20 homolog [Plasmodium gonderi]